MVCNSDATRQVARQPASHTFQEQLKQYDYYVGTGLSLLYTLWNTKHTGAEEQGVVYNIVHRNSNKHHPLETLPIITHVPQEQEQIECNK